MREAETKNKTQDHLRTFFLVAASTWHLWRSEHTRRHKSYHNNKAIDYGLKLTGGENLRPSSKNIKSSPAPIPARRPW